MTIVEFYDKVSIENIAGALLCDADHIILIGDNRGRMERSIKVYEKILKNRNIETTFSYRCINRNDLSNIVNILSEIVETDKNCVFDLTGGEDLYLVGIGIVLNKYNGRIQCHRFNFNNNMIYDCDADGTVCATAPFLISVEENVAIYGGMIVTDQKQPLHTYLWDYNEEFINDVELMWDMCKDDVGYWNVETSVIGGVCEIIKVGDSLDVSSDYDTVSNALYKKHIDIKEYTSFLYKLSRLKLIHSLRIEEDKISFTFKNEQIKQILTLAGRLLELIIATRLMALTDKNGNPIYHDVLVGAVIDWDQIEDPCPYRTINEIDVLAMKGAIPVFISCKNGNFDETELYKLATVAERFGNKYAKKVLVTTKLDKFGLKSDYLRARMNDMNIRCIDNLTALTDEQLNSSLKNL